MFTEGNRKTNYAFISLGILKRFDGLHFRPGHFCISSSPKAHSKDDCLRLINCATQVKVTVVSCYLVNDCLKSTGIMKIIGKY